MRKNIFALLFTLSFSLMSAASDFELKLACKAAAQNMPNGTGGTVYYPNGRTLTSSAGKAGATWYYPNGRTLSSGVGSKGATYYHSNGRTFSSSTGSAGATWYFSNGRTITSSGPELSAKEMAKLACDLVTNSTEE